jgi:hypothetical protein
MGYYVQYILKLHIKPENIAKALEIFNHLHTPEMLLKHARAISFPKTNKKITEVYRYSWVDNPIEPYASLTEAFDNWWLVNEDKIISENDIDGFTLSGKYTDKIGQQDFLISQLAPVLSDTHIHVLGQDGTKLQWIVKNHLYTMKQTRKYIKKKTENTYINL